MTEQTRDYSDGAENQEAAHAVQVSTEAQWAVVLAQKGAVFDIVWQNECITDQAREQAYGMHRCEGHCARGRCSTCLWPDGVAGWGALQPPPGGKGAVLMGIGGDFCTKNGLFADNLPV